MATEFDSGGGSKKRLTDEEGEQAAEEEDRISALPDALRLHILGLLPLKSAIRTGALSTHWRGLWTRRWPAPGSLDFRLGPHDSPQPLLESLERRGRRRLDRFSLSFQIGLLTPKDLGRCLDYAADCDVADLDVNLLDLNDAYDLCFSFGSLPTNPHLARLSLSGICIFPTNKAWYLSELRYLPRPYSVLEVIHLHRVTVEDVSLYHLVAACPRLRTLDIRYCDEDLRRASIAKYRAKVKANLTSLTVVECESLTDIYIINSSSLRSFRYSGAYLAADTIPTRSAIEDIYICFGGPACRQLRSRRRVKYDDYGRPRKPHGCWLDRLIKLSNLTVLTLCSSALRRVSAKARARSSAGNAASCKLQSLREVQLLMFAMDNENLGDIMAFLCCTPRLERLFVQLPTRSNQYKPNEEPSESEEDGSEEELSEVESSKEYLSNGEESESSEEDQSEQNDEDGSEEDHPKDSESEEQGFAEGETNQDESEEEESSEEDHSQEDESEEDYSQDDESEEDYSQDDESEEDHSQDISEEEGSEEDHPKEDESDENGLAEGQSKDGSKKELSDGGQSVDELLGDGFGNLMLLNMMNFMGHHNEMRLVSLVLKKSGCLNQLILFTPESDHLEGPQKDHLNTSDFLQKKLLPLEKASPYAQIILSKPDAAAIKPLHSETFVKV